MSDETNWLFRWRHLLSTASECCSGINELSAPTPTYITSNTFRSPRFVIITVKSSNTLTKSSIKSDEAGLWSIDERKWCEEHVWGRIDTSRWKRQKSETDRKNPLRETSCGRNQTVKARCSPSIELIELTIGPRLDAIECLRELIRAAFRGTPNQMMRVLEY